MTQEPPPCSAGYRVVLHNEFTVPSFETQSTPIANDRLKSTLSWRVISRSHAALKSRRDRLLEESMIDAVGESGQLTVTLKNTGVVPLTRSRIHVPALPGAYVFPSGSSATGIALQPNEEHTTSFNVRVVTSRAAPTLPFNLTGTR